MTGEGTHSPALPAAPQLLHSLMRTMMPRAHRTPAQMSPLTRRLCQSRRNPEGTLGAGLHPPQPSPLPLDPIQWAPLMCRCQGDGSREDTQLPSPSVLTF